MFGIGACTFAPIVGFVEAMGEHVEGHPVAPLESRQASQEPHVAGHAWLLGLALAGIDMCAWDALAQAVGQPW